MQDSIFVVLDKLLSKNLIFFDKQEFNFQIQSHPSYPSLFSITDVLNHFGIDNVAADVPINSETLVQLPNYFIAQVYENSSKDLVFIDKTKKEYSLYNSKGKTQNISEDEFLKKFTGIIVAVEKQDNNNHLEKKTNLFEFICIGLLISFSVFYFYNEFSQWYNLFYFITCVFGLIVSVSLIKKELGLKTTIGDAFCSTEDDKKKCDAVLTSKGAKIFKNYKLSDFSLLYFSGLSVLTFIQISNPVISFFISLLALPITVYSLYYQYIVLKKWCFLCLNIVAVLWIQALIPIITNNYLDKLILNDLLVSGFIFLVVILVWYYVKPILTEIQKLRKEKIESVKFKRNYNLFESLLNKSDATDTYIKGSKEIVFGNSKSNLEIVIITNPFCGHCKPVHKRIHKILQSYHHKVKIKIRFNINMKDDSTDVVKITSRLIELFNTTGESECLKAMGDIYDGEKAKKWLKKWGNCIDKEAYILELNRHKQWCKENKINFTPEILINSKPFPKEYQRTDLIYFIEDLSNL